MAEQLELQSSKKSKGLFGKLSFHKKGKMRYQRVGLEDEESLMCDDKHETNNHETVKMQNNDKTEVFATTRKRHNGNEVLMKEGSTLETEIREARLIQRDSVDDPYHGGVQLTDVDLCASEVIPVAVTPENASVVKVNAIIESNNDNSAERPLEENDVDFLVTANEFYKSEECLLQNKKSTITSHFDNLSVTHPETPVVNGEVGLREVQISPGAEYKTEDSQARMSRAKENAINVDNLEDSLMSETTPCISTHTHSINHGEESPRKKKNPRKKKKPKKMQKSNRKNKENCEATSDEETSLHVHFSDSRDPETIEILARDSDAKKEKKKKRRKRAKRMVARVKSLLF